MSVSQDMYDPHGCALGEDGAVVCWGEGARGDVVGGEFVQVAAGGGGSGCGLRPGGRVECWGGARFGVPEGSFAAVYGGYLHWCALDAAGSLVCWGGPGVRGVPDPPSGGFVEVSGAASGRVLAHDRGAGADYVCGLRVGGELECWAAEFGLHRVYGWVPAESSDGAVVRDREGRVVELLKTVDVSSDYGQAVPPVGRFVSVSAASDHACAVDTGGRVVCWGSDDRHQVDPAVPGWGWSVNRHSCSYRSGYDYDPPPGPVDCRIERGVRDDGFRVSEEITSEDPSWGSWEFWGVYDEVADPLRGPFVEVSAGGGGGCGLRADAALVCWGVGFYGRGPDALDGVFTAVAVGDHHACALRERSDDTDSNVVCWGIDDRPPPLQQLYACKRYRGDDGITNASCGGPDPRWPQWRNQTEAPPGVYTELSAGANHTCAITQHAAAVCWGDNRAGQTDAPEGEFTEVSAVADSSCGLRVDKTPVCWGAVAGLRPPPGEFISVSAAGRGGRPCGIREDNSVACWGYGPYGEPPAWVAPLVDASIGYKTSCGVQADGAVACWDNHTKADPYLVSGTEPPQGEFVAVSVVGNDGYCALRNDGSVVCDNYWGSSGLQPPRGEFTDVTAGDEHACGIRTDGTVACWGSDGIGVTREPGGRLPVSADR